MRDLEYLQLLADQYPSETAAASELLKLSCSLNLPKGTEYFFSDLHGEHEAFIHLLRSASGVIRDKIEALFEQTIPESERSELAGLIYYPERQLAYKKKTCERYDEWCEIEINRLIAVAREVISKYGQDKVRRTLDSDFAKVIEDMLYMHDDSEDKRQCYRSMLSTTIEIGMAEPIITALCHLIQGVAVDHLHIIGDIFDRGPRADRILDELCNHRHVDVQWGNHDISWMGAMCGNPVNIANVLRIAVRYNSFDLLEDGYGINLRPLSMFANEVYGDDPCERFMPEILDENKYDPVDPVLAAKMHKAIAVLQFKLEGQLIERNPEFEMEDRLLLDKIDYEAGTITLDGKVYPMLDCHFPTIDPADPYKLTDDEARLMEQLTASFLHSRTLKRHIDFLYAKGGMYKIVNGNLLYHGCVPMNEDGSFASWTDGKRSYTGRALFDHIDRRVRSAYFTRNQRDVDLMWYLWCGALSPVYGKDKMTTFERYFIADRDTYKETMSPYYTHCERSEACERILEEFGLDGRTSHIINGHVPVRRGENPVKAGGRLYVIDGGISKAYQSKTGIAGYTLVYNSHYIALGEHQPFRRAEEGVMPTETHAKIRIVEMMQRRKLVADTDAGERIRRRIEDLRELIAYYRSGVIRDTSGDVTER